MVRRRARIDSNQTEIVNALRTIGAEVTILSGVGHGVPDILVSYAGKWYVIEIKDGDKVPSAQKLTPDEVAWAEKQKAPVYVVNSVVRAIQVLQGNR